MIMGAFIPALRRKYPPYEYVSALLLVVGLILFTLADAQTSPNFSVIGVAMISGALIMDAFLGNLQEAIFTMNPGTTQVACTFYIFYRALIMWICDLTCSRGTCDLMSRIHGSVLCLCMQMEMLLCSTVVGLPMLIPPMLLTGEFFRAWSSCSQV